jgi:hypothetical protein
MLREIFLFQEKMSCKSNTSHFKINSLIKKISFSFQQIFSWSKNCFLNKKLLCIVADTVYWQTIGISTYICNFYADILQIFWQTIDISANICNFYADILQILLTLLQLCCSTATDMWQILADILHICQFGKGNHIHNWQ